MITIKANKKSKRKLDVGDWVYIDPEVKTDYRASKLVKQYAGQIGRCVERNSSSWNLSYKVRFDNQKEFKVRSIFARKCTEQDYNDLKAGKLSIISSTELEQAARNKKRDYLFNGLKKIGLTITEQNNLRRCEFASKYPTQPPIFYIEEYIEKWTSNGITTSKIYVRALIPSAAHHRINKLLLNHCLIHSVATTYVNINNICDTIKQYLISNFVPGINYIDEYVVTLNDAYQLHSINDEPAIVSNYMWDKYMAWYKNNREHRDVGYSYLRDTGYGSYAYEGVHFYTEELFNKYKAKQEFLKTVNNSKNNIFDKDFIGEIT